MALHCMKHNYHQPCHTVALNIWESLSRSGRSRGSSNSGKSRIELLAQLSQFTSHTFKSILHILIPIHMLGS